MTSARGRVEVEVEVKLALDPTVAATLATHPAIRALRRGPVRSSTMRSIYHDTPDRRLARAGIALRARREARRWTIAVKGAGRGTTTLAARPEVEWPSSTPVPDPLRLSATPWRRVFARALAQGGLAPVFETRIERTTIPVGFDDGTTATIALDRGSVTTIGADDAPRRSAPICEVEIELERGDPARLLDLAGMLADEIGCTLEPRSKAERGYALVDGVRPSPARARDVDLEAATSAREAAVAILLECVRQIESNAIGFPSPVDPEWVHQMRIGVRRLRSLVALADTLFPPERLVHLKRETRWLLDTLGPARDLDVFATETLPLALADRSFGPIGSEHRPWDRRAFARRLAARRRAAREHADDAIGSPRFVRFVLSAIATAMGPDEDTGRPGARGVTARAYADRRLERRARRLAKAGNRLARAGDDERHAVRIAAKKLRYATEFYAPLFPRRRTREFRQALARLQDVLGEFNDAVVAPRVAAEVAGPASAIATALGGWSRARADALADPIDAAWRRYALARPFWTRA